jgi:hypothetical protein
MATSTLRHEQALEIADGSGAVMRRFCRFSPIK